MNEHPLISIVTVTYNAGKTLEPTMLSLGEQDFRDFEHIVIDGASTDNTLALARRLGGSSLRLLSEPDGGLYDAMNKGLRMARGEYVLFLNAGDSLHERATLTAFADAAAGGADIIYGDTVVVDTHRRVLRPRHKTAPARLTRESWLKGMLICHQAFMVRRELAAEYDLQYRFSSDYEWTLRCIEASDPDRCVNLNRITTDFLDAGMTTRNHSASLHERFHIMRRHFGLARTLRSHALFLLKR